MGMKRTKLFRCRRCGMLSPKNLDIKDQRYCLNCVRPRGHKYKTWSTGRDE